MNIAYITGTRAEFGLITPLLTAINNSKVLSLSLYATGMHLSKPYGYTIQLVKKAFPDAAILDVSYGNKRSELVAFGARLTEKVAHTFERRRPGLVLVHGDRIEMLAVALASLYLGVPVAHIHGGDKTRTVDDATRNAITQLSYLHFPATKKGAERIEKMGTERSRIHVVGALGLDALRKARLKSRTSLMRMLSLTPNSRFILVLQHPVSEEIDSAGKQMSTTIAAVKRCNLPIVVIYPNGDPGSSTMIGVINKEKNNPLFRIYPNLDYETFATLQKEAAVWVGNSSAGIVESTYFNTPVVNVGIRQEGRERSPNIIDVPVSIDAIYKAMNKILNDPDYRSTTEPLTSPWGDGRAAERIMEVLENTRWIPSG